MKTIQKLEVGFGLATLVGTLIFFCVSVLRYTAGEKENYGLDDIYQSIFFEGGLLFIVPGLMIGIGSVVHTVRQSSVGLIAVLLGGTVLVLIFGFSFLGFAVFGGWLRAFTLSTPGLLAAFTMYFAYRSRNLKKINR